MDPNPADGGTAREEESTMEAEDRSSTTCQPTAESFEAEIYYRMVSARTAVEYMRELETLCGLKPENQHSSIELPKNNSRRSRT